MHAYNLVLAYTAGEAITKHRILQFSADDTVTMADATDDLMIGVSTDVDAASGDTLDVVHSGVALIEAGDAVTRGQWQTSGTDGVCLDISDPEETAIGIALRSGVAGDLVPVLILPNKPAQAAA